MSWNGPDTTPASVRIATVFPALNSSEQRVAAMLASDPGLVVDCTAQELARHAGVARSTVVRTCQSLGYAGYPQLRVALARELSTHESANAHDASSGSGQVRAAIAQSAESLRAVASTLTDAALEDVLDAIAGAHRMLVVGNGLSAPIAAETALRLTVSERPAEHVADGLAQRVFAAHLGPGDVCLVLSSTGADPDSVAAARAAGEAGARVLALTSFAESPLVETAHLPLVVPSGGPAFRSPAAPGSRLAHALVLEALVEAVVRRRASTPLPG